MLIDMKLEELKVYQLSIEIGIKLNNYINSIGKIKETDKKWRETNDN